MTQTPITGNEPAFAKPSLAQNNNQSRENDFDYREEGSHGLTIRQHFAGLAMQAILSHSGSVYMAGSSDSAALEAVRCADALIAALNQ